MNISKYKKGLLSDDPKMFSSTLRELKTDLQREENIYTCLKRINTFLCKTINCIDKNEIIENDVYRVVPLKYSMLYMLTIGLQSEIESTEKQIKHQKYVRTYSYMKQMGINPEKSAEETVINKTIPYILQILDPFTDKKMYGYNDICEIEETISKSKLVSALNNISLLKEREMLFQKTSQEKKISTKDAFQAHLSEMSKHRRESIELNLGENIFKSKITILHMPLFHKEYPSIYLEKINSVLICEFMKSDIKESRIFAEFGMYVQHTMTGSITKLPDGFVIQNKSADLFTRANLFFDLFAYKVMEGTPLENKHEVKNNLKPFPNAMREFLRDARYFDILVDAQPTEVL